MSFKRLHRAPQVALSQHVLYALQSQVQFWGQQAATALLQTGWLKTLQCTSCDRSLWHFEILSDGLTPTCSLRFPQTLHCGVFQSGSRPLTLRLLMSYIYMEHLSLMFLDHTQRRSTTGRTPLDEWSARRRDLYLTTHDTHNRQISMPPVGFEPKISPLSSPIRATYPAHLIRLDFTTRTILGKEYR